MPQRTLLFAPLLVLPPVGSHAVKQHEVPAATRQLCLLELRLTGSAASAGESLEMHWCMKPRQFEDAGYISRKGKPGHDLTCLES